jgi:hypothetical protein
MKILKYLTLYLVIAFFMSCEEHEIDFMTTDVADGVAEFQLHYYVPVTATSSNYIYRVEINNSLYANSTAPLYTYNVIPNGSVGKFYTVDAGTVNIKLYKGSDLELVYDKDVTLTEGKQNIFVYDFDENPIVFDNGYPYESSSDEYGDTTAFVKFYNFLYEDADTPTDLILQYQWVDPDTDEVINLGEPISFGETTGWQPIKVSKTVYNSSGYCRIYYKLKVVDDDGNIGDDLSLIKSSGSYSTYSDYWTAYIGRHYHHTMAGCRTELPVSSVRQFTAL